MAEPSLPPPDEVIPSTEGEDLAVITRISQEILDITRRPIRRGQHPKQHGVVRAEFTVEPDVPDDLRHGLFLRPRTYPAWIRFSNGSQDDDAKGDIHGMAIKLMGVEGRKILKGEEDKQTQDFVLMDHPAFFSRDARSNRGLAEAVRRSIRPSLLKSLMFWIRDERARRSAYIAVDYFILRLRFHELKMLRDAVSKKPRSPLGITYWSATPYLLGPLAVKYSARPIPSGVPEPTDVTSPDRLRKAMVDHLARAEARFNFLVQVRTSAGTMPIEDASVIWSEAQSPFRKVASIVIPPQTFDTPQQMTFCENLSNTPWHSLPEHRPIGGINRVRKVVYQVISEERHELNNAPRREPDPQTEP
jgi:hypothetical protein